MNAKLFFTIFACAVVILSVITICLAPIINNISSWRSLNCKQLKDEYDDDKKKEYSTNEVKDQILDYDKRELNKCNRHKAMNDLEYTSLIMDLVLGFICFILGLLHYFEIGKYCEKVTGIIGLASGIIGFILTIIYVGYSGYIFDNHPSGGNGSIRTNYLLYSNGARYKTDTGKFVPPYDEEKYKKNSDLEYAKYKDLGKKQYNYNSDLYKYLQDSNSEYNNCKYSSISGSTTIKQYNNKNCEYAWITSDFKDNNNNKYLFDKWLTSIIFSSLIFVCDLGLALFGFLLFKQSGN